MTFSKFLILISLSALLVLGCASSPHRISTEETAPNSSKTYSDFMIIGAYNDRPYRVSSETAFADILKSKGIQASPSYDILPQLDDLDSADEMAKKLMATEHDALLVIATLDEGYDYDVGDYYATRGLVYLLGGEPGAGTDMGAFIAWAGSGIYSLYVGLWDADSYKPVWQIKTSSETTGSESGDTKTLADFVVEQLREKGLLKAM